MYYIPEILWGRDGNPLLQLCRNHLPPIFCDGQVYSPGCLTYSFSLVSRNPDTGPYIFLDTNAVREAHHRIPPGNNPRPDDSSGNR